MTSPDNGPHNDPPNDPDDEDARQRGNMIALGFVVLLVVGAVWLIHAYMESRDQMDCFLGGRRNCPSAQINQ